MLAVFSAPQNSELLARHVHQYVDALFKVFPQNLSGRQFRMAVKTLIRITSPPAVVSDHQPLLPSTLLELIRFRIATASSRLVQESTSHPNNGKPNSSPEDHQQPLLSEQSVLVLTLIDALPFLPIGQLEDWLPVTAQALNTVQNANQLQICRQTFWDVLSRGDMDVDRSALCVMWWGTRGGREMVLYGGDQGRDQLDEGPFMSGGLQEVSKL